MKRGQIRDLTALDGQVVERVEVDRLALGDPRLRARVDVEVVEHLVDVRVVDPCAFHADRMGRPPRAADRVDEREPRLGVSTKQEDSVPAEARSAVSRPARIA